MRDSMDPGIEKRAKLYYRGFFILCACELVVNVVFISQIRGLFDSGPVEIFLIGIFGYMLLSIAFAAGILWCLFRSRQIRKETGKTRWSI